MEARFRARALQEWAQRSKSPYRLAWRAGPRCSEPWHETGITHAEARPAGRVRIARGELGVRSAQCWNCAVARSRLGAGVGDRAWVRRGWKIRLCRQHVEQLCGDVPGRARLDRNRVL